MLDLAVREMTEAGIEKILLTVSPVPLGTTFTDSDATVANSFSKAALRVCAEKLREDYPQVDYFPSYEMATSGGLDVFIEDNVHVRRDVVDVITRYMLRAYFPNLAPGASKDTEGLVSGAQA